MHAESGWGRRAWLPRIGLVMFTLSGAAGLVDELCWVRGLKVILGSTIFSISVVLTVFMAGLGFGALFFGRRSDRLARPWRAYAWIEMGIAVTVLLTPLLFRLIEIALRAVPWVSALPPYPRAMVQSLPVMIAILPPTFLMGGTLPVMTRALRTSLEEVGPRVAALYAANVLGGVTGVLGATWVLIPRFGVLASLAVAAACNVAIASAAFALGRSRVSRPEEAAPAAPATEPAPTGSRRALPWLYAGFLVSGFAALAIEVLWSRVLSWILGSSVYAFALVLAAYLVGVGAGGALIASRRELMRRPLRWLFALETISALATLVLFVGFSRLPPLYGNIMSALRTEAALFELVQLAIVVMLLVVPTAALGAIFPIFTHCIAQAAGGVGRGVGTGYFANTCGTIAGSWIAGFVLVPVLGVERGMLLAAALSLIVGLGALLGSGDRLRRRLAWAAGSVAAFVGLGAWATPLDYRALDSGVYIHGNFFFQFHLTPLMFTEGTYTNVSVYDIGNQRILKLDGKLQGSTAGELYTQFPLAYLPLCYARDARKVLNIGLGTGVTAGSFTIVPPVQSVTVVEIAEEVYPAVRFFREMNHDLDRSPKLRMVFDDARHYCATTRDRYDIIASEPPNLWSQGSTQLFTVEAYRDFARLLTPGGIACQWFHTLGMTRAELAIALRSFAEVFPHVALFSYGPEAVIILGSAEPLVPRPDAIAALEGLDAVRTDLARILLPGFASLLGHMVLDEEDVRRYAAGAVLNTDDHPRLEFVIPRQMWMGGEAVVTALREDPTTPTPVERAVLPGIGDERTRLRIAIADAAYRRRVDRLCGLATDYLGRYDAEDMLLEEIRLSFEGAGRPGAYLDCLDAALERRADPLVQKAAALMRYTIWAGSFDKLDRTSSEQLRKLALDAARLALQSGPDDQMKKIVDVLAGGEPPPP